MSLTRAIVFDRTGMLGAGAGVLSGLPPEIALGYLVVRVLLPAALIVFATRGATPAQRIGLVREYLIGEPAEPSRPRSRR